MIARRTLESRQKSFELVDLRLQQGVANRVELRQAESLVQQTAAIIPELERLIEQQENLIQVLLGDNPGEIVRGNTLLEQDLAIDVPLGLPSSLLQRRPDVLIAEQSLIAANARIGEARALLYPAIRLTVAGGVGSAELGDLFDAGSLIWRISQSIVQPSFESGRLSSNVEVTEAQMRQAVMRYQQTLQLGIEVLDSERDHFDAEPQLVRSIRNELFAIVILYRALGGGWQGAEELVPVDADENPEGS